MKKIIGVDIDGVLADFNASFINLVIELTQKDLFPMRPFDIPTWNYPQHYGYTDSEIAKVWATIERSPDFWRALPSYPATQAGMGYLRTEESYGADIYFVTSRPGLTSKLQTERWLRRFNVDPTVLISGKKGLVAAALGFTHYIDDRYENVIDVSKVPGCEVALMDRPWNQTDVLPVNVTRVSTVAGFCLSPETAASPVS